MAISEAQAGRLEQKANDARDSAEIAGDEVAMLERLLDARKSANPSESEALDAQLERARRRQTSAVARYEELARDCEERVSGFKRKPLETGKHSVTVQHVEQREYFERNTAASLAARN